MPTTVPPGVVADAMLKVAWVPTLADPSAPKIATEIKAVASVELSCYLAKDGFSPSGEAQTVADERLCSRQTFEDFGTVTYTIDDLTYVYDVQNAASVSNKAYAAMTTGATGYLIVRWGKDVDVDWTVADKVDVYPVKLGPRNKQAPEANSKLKVKQKPFVTGPRLEDVALAA